jgi:hypothetical protein
VPSRSHRRFKCVTPLAPSLHAAAALVSKGRLIACTVLGLMPNSSAIFRTPLVRPGSFNTAGTGNRDLITVD